MLQNLTEKIFGVLVLLFYTGAIAPFIRPGNPLEPLLLGLPHITALITVILLALRWEKTLLTIIRVPFFWLMMAIVVLSPFWSNIPGETWAEIVPLLRVTLFSLYLASRYSLKEILQLLGWALGSVAVLSVLFGAFLPYYGVMGKGYIGQSQDWVHEGAWRGVYIHKTLMGTIMTLTALVCLYLVSWRNALRPLALFALPMAIIALVMSTTKAALVILIFVLGCIPFYRALRWKPKHLALLLTIGLSPIALTIGILLSNFTTLLAMFGKTTTLSGRTVMWPLVIENIGYQPWFGYGYDTFWLNGWEGDVANIWSRLPRGFEPPHAHNAFLDVLLSFGWVGFAVFILNLLIFGWRAFRWVRADPTAEGLAPLLLLTFMILTNLTESFWFTPNIFWVGYVTMAITIAQRRPHLPYLEIYPLSSEETCHDNSVQWLTPFSGASIESSH